MSIADKLVTIAENEQKVYKSGYNKAVKDCQTQVLKGTASGTIVSMKDVSPIEHEIKVKASSKNLSPVNNVEFTRYTRIDFAEPLKTGTYTISAIAESEANVRMLIRFVDDEEEVISYFQPVSTRQSLTVTMNIKATTVYLYSNTNATNSTSIKAKFSDFQIEEGTVATTYSPYVEDVSAAKVKAYGQNLLDIDAGLNECLVKNADGSYTMKKTSTNNRMSGKIPFSTGSAISCSCYCEILENTTIKQGVSVFLYDVDGEYAHSVSLRDDGGIYRLPANVVFARIILESSETGSITFKNPQIAAVKTGNTPITDYEPFIEPIEYDILADGNVEGVNSLYPATTLVPDTNGVLVEAEYNRDINKAFEELTQAIISLGCNV